MRDILGSTATDFKRLEHGLTDALYAGELFTSTNSTNLSEDEIGAIHFYTQEKPKLYRAVSTVLSSTDRGLNNPLMPYIKLLLRALYKLPLRPMTAWRGVKADLMDRYDGTRNPNKLPLKFEVFFPITSCSATKEVAKNFLKLGQQGDVTPTLFSITSRCFVDIRPFSSIPDEDEVILLPGTNWSSMWKRFIAFVLI